MARLLVLLLLPLPLVGCGNQYGTVPVRGKVTFNGGPMPVPGVVYFTPVEAVGDNPLRPAAADFGPDGTYSVYAFEKSEGLFPGTYRVHLHCWKIPPTMGGPVAVSHLPPKYERGATSGLQLKIEAGSAAKEFNIDVSNAP